MAIVSAIAVGCGSDDARDSDDGREYIEQGVAYHKKGDYDRAIDCFTKAIQIDRSKAQGYFNRGIAWVSKGEHGKAIEDFTAALRIGPQDAEAYDLRGSAWTEVGEYDKAIEDHSKALAIDPQDPITYGKPRCGAAYEGRVRRGDRGLQRGSPPRS
jgi:tetratricopeptide (TPR) repeat protein